MTASPIVAWLEDHRPDYLLVRTEMDRATKDLYFQADRPIWNSRPRVLDFVAVALTQYAANLHRNLYIRGSLTTSQLDNLAEYLQVWSTWKPDCFQNISISCDEEIELSRSARPSALAFSGGVDSSYSLLVHNRKMLGRLSVPVGIGVLIVGWDIRHGDPRAADTALRKAEGTLDAFGSRCVAIRTNWQQDFCPEWFLGYNAGVACILQTLRDEYSCGIFASNGLHPVPKTLS